MHIQVVTSHMTLVRLAGSLFTLADHQHLLVWSLLLHPCTSVTAAILQTHTLRFAITIAAERIDP